LHTSGHKCTSNLFLDIRQVGNERG
jgi:hypothetical protein